MTTEDSSQDKGHLESPHPPMNNKVDINNLKEALKKDYRALLVKQFSTNWEIERLVRQIELDVMQLPSLQAAIERKILATQTKAFKAGYNRGRYDEAHGLPDRYDNRL